MIKSIKLKNNKMNNDDPKFIHKKDKRKDKKIL